MAFNNRGAALREREQLVEALADYRQAIALKPDFAEAFSNAGIVLHELGALRRRSQATTARLR
jgi:Flp pilus assembly protein TadD